MKKRFLTLLIFPFLLIGCGSNYKYQEQSVSITNNSGEISAFKLLTPENGYHTNKGFTFTWEEAGNADYYQLELANTPTFINDEDEVYVKESNISLNRFDLNYTLPKKDILYYWRVTAINKDHTKECDAMGNFFYESEKVGELPIEIEDEQDWVLHKEGSYADIKVDRSNFFGNNKNSLVITFDKEHTCQGIAKSDGWIVITKTEDRELYGTDSFYFNFYYSGHDATVLVRVLDYDGEYWHQQVQISNNAKQTILMKYEDFELRTAGTNIFNRVFDWEHIRYFEIVFERTFGDGICVFSDIKAVKYDEYNTMFMEKMDFRSTDMNTWTYENFNFPKTVSDDGSELTLTYNTSDGFYGYGFQAISVYRYFVRGDALRMKVKYTGSSANAVFYFRIMEEDNDRWQFKVSFNYLVKDGYKEIIIPLKAFQRMDYMAGDGAKQFYFIQKVYFGLAENFANGTLSLKDLEVIRLDDILETRVRTLGEDGCIDNFNNYNIYTEMYYNWDQSSVNKDEAMKLDTVHKTGGAKNTYCAEFDYKADMEQAVYQIYLNSKAVVGKTALSLWLKDAAPKPTDATFDYLAPEDITAEMTIQLTLDTGEWYRYTIGKVTKEWNKYTIHFDDFTLFNGNELIGDPNPLLSEHIIHLAFGFRYLFFDQQGNHHPTYAIANPMYIDEIYLVTAPESSIEEISGTIKPDKDNPNKVTIDTFENYADNEAAFENWSYAKERDYNEMALSDEVSSQGGSKSWRMHYKGYESVSYERRTPFATSVTAKGFAIDIKSDGKATIYLNINLRSGGSLLKYRYTLEGASSEWTHYELGFDTFVIQSSSSVKLNEDTCKNVETISFGIVNSDYSASNIYVDNIRFLNTIELNTESITAII